MSLSGNLKTMALADLLQFISANGSSGTLQIRSHQIVKMIFFEKGKIVSSSSSDPKEYLGHFLLSHGYITEEELKIAMEIQRSSKMLIGKILVLSGKLKQDQMTRLLKLKSEETVYSLFLWEEGEFVFFEDKFTDRLYVRVSLDPQSLILEGTMRRDEWGRIRKTFPHSNFVLEKAPDPDLSRLDGKTLRIYDLVDGKKTVEELILSAHTTEFAILRALNDLNELGHVRVKSELPHSIERKADLGDFSVTQLLELGKERMDQGKFEEGLDFLCDIDPGVDNYEEEIAPLIKSAETKAVKQIYSDSLPPDKVPKPMISPADFADAGLTPEEGFLLSRIDGSWDISAILSVTPMKEFDVLRLMKKLLKRGIIGFE